MAEKKRATGGAPSWMVTFADMMALLLCLFVLLLSFSTMDAQKFERIAGELEKAFGLTLKNKLLGVEELGGVPERDFVSSANRAVSEMPPPADETAVELPPPDVPQTEEADAKQITDDMKEAHDKAVVEKVAEEMTEKLSDVIQAGQVQVEPSDKSVLIRFNSNYLFDSGSADIYVTTEELFAELATILAQTEGEIQVSGHTDDVPISNGHFRSNWDLSSARAASLVHMLLQNGDVDPSRIGATGYADSRPIADNATEDGRALNRRVEIRLRIP